MSNIRTDRSITLLILMCLILPIDRTGFAQEAAKQVEQADETDKDSEDVPEQEQELKKDAEEPPQLSEMDLIVRVEELQTQLASDRIPDRDTAEVELIKLGPGVLDHMEILEDTSPDAKIRMMRIRKELEKVAAAAVTLPSRVSINGTVTIQQAFDQLKQQTQNDIGLVEGVSDEIADMKIDLELDDSEFWPAVKTIMEKGKLQVAPYDAGPGQLRLIPENNGEQGLAMNPAAQPVAKIELPNNQAGIFNIEVTRVVSSRNLASPNNSHTTLSLRIRWEPRIRPISIDMALASLKVVDDFGKPIPVLNEEANISGMVQPEIPELEFSIPLKLVDRQIEEIKLIEADLNAILPGRIETFKFRNIGNLEVGAEQEKAGVVVGFGGISKNEDLFAVQVDVGFSEESQATESYQGWVYDNEVALMDREGKLHPNIGLESNSTKESRMGVLYYFEIDPKDCTLVYKTPAAIVKQPIRIKLEKIPLP